MPSGEPAAAMIAASPLLLAPGERVRSYGLRVPPCSGFQLSPPVPPGGQLDLPSRIAPAERMRAITVASLSGTLSFSLRRPAVVATPAVSKMSLAVNGTPCSGGGSKPRLARWRSAAFACRMALSLVTQTIALRRGLTAPMCSRCARTTSSEESRPSRMARASQLAGAPTGSRIALDHDGCAVHCRRLRPCLQASRRGRGNLSRPAPAPGSDSCLIKPHGKADFPTRP